MRAIAVRFRLTGGSRSGPDHAMGGKQRPDHPPDHRVTGKRFREVTLLLHSRGQQVRTCHRQGDP